MNKTRELLRRTAGSVDAYKSLTKDEGQQSRCSSKTPSSPLASTRRETSPQHEGAMADRGSDEEEKKWRQRLVESKVFKRLMQPAYVEGGNGKHHAKSNGDSNAGGSGDNGGGTGGDGRRSGRNSADDYNAPWLGEIPVRSKYHRPDQNKAHFANHPTYLPLAKECGPPQLASSGGIEPPGLRPRQPLKEVEYEMQYQYDPDSEGGPTLCQPPMEDEGDGGVYGYGELDGVDGHRHQHPVDMNMEDVYEHEMEDNLHAGYGAGSLREAALHDMPGSYRHQHLHDSATASQVSGASSVGPTGLALMPQFRWVPKQGGGGLGFNPFMNFRRTPQQQQQQHLHDGTLSGTPGLHGLTSPMQLSTRTPRLHFETPDLMLTAPSPDQPHPSEHQVTATYQGSYSFFYGTPTPPPPGRSTSPSRLPRETVALSFYGPIGSIGLETSHKRRALERQTGTEGAAERAYKERTARRPVEGDDTSVLLITQLWCDVRLLQDARFVDSPCLNSEEDSNSDSVSELGSDEDDDAAVAAGATDEEVMAAREEKVRQRRRREERRRQRQQRNHSLSPSFYFKENELGLFRVEDGDDVAAQGTRTAAAGAVAATRQAATPAVASPTGRQRREQKRQQEQQQQPSPAVATSNGKAASPRRRGDGGADGGRRDDEDDAGSCSSSASSSSSGSERERRSSDDNDSNSDDNDSNSDDGSSAGDRSDWDDEEGSGEDIEDSPRAGKNRRRSGSGNADAEPSYGGRRDSMLPAPGAAGRSLTIGMSTGPGMGRSLAGDGQYDFMNSSVMGASFPSPARGGNNRGRGTSQLYPRDYDDDGEAAAAMAADLVPNRAPPRSRAPGLQSADVSIVNMTPHPPPSPSTPARSQQHKAPPPPQQQQLPLQPAGQRRTSAASSTPTQQASGNGAAAAAMLRGQRRVGVATDTRGGSAASSRHTPGHDAGSGAVGGRGGGAAAGDRALGEQLTYGSSFDLQSRRNSYSTTAFEESRDVASMSPSMYGAVSNRRTGSPGTYLMDAVDQAASRASPAGYRDSRGSTVSPGAFSMQGYGGTNSPTAASAGRADAGSLPPVAALATITAAPTAVYSPAPSRTSAARSGPPPAPTPSRQPTTQPIPAGRVSYPGGYLAPITPPDAALLKNAR